MSQSDAKANAKIHADLSELIFNYHDSLYSECLLSMRIAVLIPEG